jgi:hypothetical protein
MVKLIELHLGPMRIWRKAGREDSYFQVNQMAD